MENNTDIFRKWYRAVTKGNPSPGECTPANAAEVAHLYQCAVAATNALMAIGTKCRISGNTSNPKRDGFTFQAGQAKFTVHPVAAPAKKGVTATSREAYHQLDKSAVVQRAAKAVLEMQGSGYLSDKQIARHMGEESGWVSARRNSIKEVGSVMVGEVLYAFEESQTTIKCPVTGKTVQGWRLAVPEPKKVEGAQIAMEL